MLQIQEIKDRLLGCDDEGLQRCIEYLEKHLSEIKSFSMVDELTIFTIDDLEHIINYGKKIQVGRKESKRVSEIIEDINEWAK